MLMQRFNSTPNGELQWNTQLATKYLINKTSRTRQLGKVNQQIESSKL